MTMLMIDSAFHSINLYKHQQGAMSEYQLFSPKFLFSTSFLYKEDD